ncbi:MAG: hypothetical protein E6471_25975, partial [Bradyrhizobium sp.]|nr:hypothetical protein [Bradyrhizobium sp.]
TGAYRSFNQTAGLSGSKDQFNYAFNIAHLHAGDVPVTPWQLLPPGRKAIGNAYDNVTASTRLGVDLNEAWTLNALVRHTDASLLFTGDSGSPSFPNATQSHHTDRQLTTREEAVWSLLGGRIRNHFGVNYVNNWSYDLAPGNPAPTIATGERIKYDWRAVAELSPRNHLVVGVEQQAERLKARVASRLQLLWPQIGEVRFDYVWNGYVGMTTDYMPRIHRLGPDAYGWTGCNGRAVALTIPLGAELAKAVRGVPDNELALPFTNAVTIPAHALLRPFAPLMLLLYRYRDAREIA